MGQETFHPFGGTGRVRRGGWRVVGLTPAQNQHRWLLCNYPFIQWYLQD